jgi:two-component system, NarL family, nitrate/nitrite response regulator NarL
MAFDDETQSPETLVLVDHLALARRGLLSLVSETGLNCAIFQAPDKPGALDLARQHPSAVILICHRPPKLDALPLLQALQTQGRASLTLIIGSDLDQRDVLSALRLDVGGLLPEGLTETTLRDAIAAVRQGARWLDMDVLHAAVRTNAGSEAMKTACLSGLTPRQTEIAALVAQGLSNKRIAYALGISEGSVKLQMNRIFKRLGYTNRAMLAAAVTLGVDQT